MPLAFYSSIRRGVLATVVIWGGEGRQWYTGGRRVFSFVRGIISSSASALLFFFLFIKEARTETHHRRCRVSALQGVSVVANKQ